MAKFKNYVEVHCHPASLDSASTPAKFAKREVELGTGAITCTDHGSMAAVLDVYDQAKANDLVPILGIEGYFRDDNCPILKSFGIENIKDYNKYYHITMHAQDQAALKAMFKVLSAAPTEKHGSEVKPLFNWQDLEYLGGFNITATSSCLVGMVQRHIQKHGRTDIAQAYYGRVKAIFKPGNFFVEVFPHACTHYWEDSVTIEFTDDTKIKVRKTKKLQLERFGEMSAEDLSRKRTYDTLLATKHYNKWEPIGKEIKSVTKQEGFIENECKEGESPDIQLASNLAVLDMAKKSNTPILISGDSHFAYPEEFILQTLRLTASSGGGWRFANSYHRQSSDEAWKHMSGALQVPQATFEGWIENSYQFKELFKGMELSFRPSLPAGFYPKDRMAYLKELINKHGRMDWSNPVYCERLVKEIQLFTKNGTIDLLPYFFPGEELCSFNAERKALSGAGRGSAAGVLLNYVLGITHVDPIRYGLSLERFLTLDRIESGALPDIDFDFSNRDEIVDPVNGWLQKRFPGHWAQISTDLTLKTKSAVKDVHRAMNGQVPYWVEELTTKMVSAPQGVSDRDFTLGHEGPDGWVDGSVETDEALKSYIRSCPKEWENVQQMLGLPKSKGRHAAAIVITDEPVGELMPLTNISGVTCTQFTMAGVERAGGIKYDFLSINSLNDVSDAIALIQQRAGVEIPPEGCRLNGRHVPAYRIVPLNGQLYDIWDLPDDSEVFADISEGRTETVFQFNTPSAKKWLKYFNFKKKNGDPAFSSIFDLATFTALDRPGPLDAMVTAPDGSSHNSLIEYARRLKGETPIGQKIDFFYDVVPETQGLLAFQEGLQLLYQRVTGCTGAEAESFRRDVAKKKKKNIEKAFPFFMANATKTMSEEDALYIWQTIQTWGNYGFCFDADQLIKTKDGLKRIEDVTEDDLVYTKDSRGRAVYEHPVNVWCSGEKEVLDVLLADGTEIRGTADHKVWTSGEWLSLAEVIEKGEIDCDSGTTTRQIKIKNVRSLGVRPVFDMEMPSGQFYLEGGVLAHNCKSHAISYVLLSYACAFLKRHYKLEWWTAVLTNAKKNEIAGEFWSYCRDFLLLPDAAHSGDQFVIENDKIRAPMSLLTGVGAAASDSLGIFRGKKTITEVCEAIAAKNKSLETPVLDSHGNPLLLKSGKPKMTAKGTIKRGLIYKIIVGGCLDSVFEPNATMLDKLGSFELAWGLAHRKKPQAVGSGMKTDFLSLNAFQRHQLQKKLLPIFSEDLSVDIEHKSDRFVRGDRYTLFVGENGHRVPVLQREHVEKIDALRLIPQEIEFAVVAYVSGVEERSWQKGQDPRKTMIKVTLDLDGMTKEFIIWPSRGQTKPAKHFFEIKAGQVACFMLAKYNADKDAAIRETLILQDLNEESDA